MNLIDKYTMELIIKLNAELTTAKDRAAKFGTFKGGCGDGPICEEFFDPDADKLLEKLRGHVSAILYETFEDARDTAGGNF